MPADRYAVAFALLLLLRPGKAIKDNDCDRNIYAVNGTFQANLNILAAALPTNASASPVDFATATIGAVPDQANGLALCCGDTNASACAACLVAAFRDAQKACPLNKGVTVLRDACVQRYAGRQFLDFLIKPDQWIVSELVYA